MFKELYNKTIQLAGHRKSKSILGFISFIESFIFPIPPDVLIIPMTIARKNEWVKIAFIATLGSVLGACLGYFIGYVFFNFRRNFFYRMKCFAPSKMISFVF